ncbi:ankyrin [Periconia macrospinosa]|uniref:Ankyrin n=1 Tax=Periconia macrospinosa TaxID=97972 RepID=A0A2V1DD62_9PLEO|nr:ankyrin [Periconia macrospinosa]
MSLLKLANELILSIAKCLDSERDINHFVQTCRRVYHVANHYLYRYHLRERGGRGVAEAAAMLGWTPLVEMLLDYGADINAPAKKGPKAAELAIRQGHVETAMLLVSRGASTSGRGSSGMDLLCRAAKHGSEELVKKLIDHGVDPRRQDDRAMWCALANGHMSIVHLLLRHGANISPGYEEWERRTALCAAIKNGHDQEMVKLLKENGASFPDRETSRMLQNLYATSNSLEAINLFLDAGANINAIGGDYGSLLQFAIHNGDMPFVYSLIERGASVHLASEDHETPLGRASAREGNAEDLELLRVLIDEHGADVNQFIEGGLTPIQRAVWAGSEKIFDFLVSRGANIDINRSQHANVIHCTRIEFVTRAQELLNYEV